LRLGNFVVQPDELTVILDVSQRLAEVLGISQRHQLEAVSLLDVADARVVLDVSDALGLGVPVEHTVLLDLASVLQFEVSLR